MVVICFFCALICEAFPVDEITVCGQSNRHTVATHAERISRFTAGSAANTLWIEMPNATTAITYNRKDLRFLII